MLFRSRRTAHRLGTDPIMCTISPLHWLLALLHLERTSHCCVVVSSNTCMLYPCQMLYPHQSQCSAYGRIASLLQRSLCRCLLCNSMYVLTRSQRGSEPSHIMMSHGLHESWQGRCRESFRIHGQPASADIRDSYYFLGSADVG